MFQDERREVDAGEELEQRVGGLRGPDQHDARFVGAAHQENELASLDLAARQRGDVRARGELLRGLRDCRTPRQPERSDARPGAAEYREAEGVRGSVQWSS